VSGIYTIILSKSWEKVSCVPNSIDYSDLFFLDHGKILADDVKMRHQYCRFPQFNGKALAPELWVYILPWVSGKLSREQYNTKERSCLVCARLEIYIQNNRGAAKFRKLLEKDFQNYYFGTECLRSS